MNNTKNKSCKRELKIDDKLHIPNEIQKKGVKNEREITIINWNDLIKDTFGEHNNEVIKNEDNDTIKKLKVVGNMYKTNKKGLVLGGYEREEEYKITKERELNNPLIKEGDFIEFTFVEDSCWGPQGTYKALISYKDGKLIANYLDDLLIHRIKSNSALYPHFDELDHLLTWCDNVKACNKEPHSVLDDNKVKEK